MGKFLPDAINTGLFQPSYKYAVGVPYIDFLKYHFTWSNITYSTTNIAFDQIEFMIVKTKENENHVRVSFPAFDDWRIMAN